MGTAWTTIMHHSEQLGGNYDKIWVIFRITMTQLSGHDLTLLDNRIARTCTVIKSILIQILLFQNNPKCAWEKS